jgi:hypothetical protein
MTISPPATTSVGAARLRFPVMRSEPMLAIVVALGDTGVEISKLSALTLSMVITSPDKDGGRLHVIAA